MARPERHDADYFPFYVKEGKTLFILESKYGLQGIGFFTNLMRFLTKQPDHHICIKEESDRLYFFAQIRCAEDIGMDMLTLMAKTGKIDPVLWEQHKVIVSGDLINSLSEAYRNRKNPIIKMDDLRVSYPTNQVSDVSNAITYADNPQRKGKERKGKESISAIKKSQFLEVVFLTDQEHQKLISKYGAPLTTKAIEILNNAIQSKGYKYKSHYHTLIGWPMKEAQGGSFRKTVSTNGERDVREYKPEPMPEISEEERQRNLKKLRGFTNAIGG